MRDRSALHITQGQPPKIRVHGSIVPIKGEEVMDPEEFQKLPAEEKQAIQKTIEGLQNELQQVMQKLPAWEQEARQQMRDLNRRTAQFAIAHLLEQIKKRYADVPEVGAKMVVVTDNRPEVGARLARRLGEELFAIGLTPGEEIRVADEAVFHDLRIASTKLARIRRRWSSRHRP